MADITEEDNYTPWEDVWKMSQRQLREELKPNIKFSDGTIVYYDADLLRNLITEYKLIRDDRQAVILVFGSGGAGKSVFTGQIMKFFFPGFNTNSHMVWDHRKLIEAGVNLPAGEPIMFDESGEAAASDKAQEKRSKRLMDFLRLSRQYNHPIALLLTDLWDWKLSLVTRHASFGIQVFEMERKVDDHVVIQKPLERGYFGYFNKDTLKKLFIDGHKYHTFPKDVHPNFTGRFRHQYVFNEEDYRKIKAEQAKIYMQEQEEDPTQRMVTKGWRHLSQLVPGIMTHPKNNFTQEELAYVFFCTRQHINQYNAGVYKLAFDKARDSHLASREARTKAKEPL